MHDLQRQTIQNAINPSINMPLRTFITPQVINPVRSSLAYSKYSYDTELGRPLSINSSPFKLQENLTDKTKIAYTIQQGLSNNIIPPVRKSPLRVQNLNLQPVLSDNQKLGMALSQVRASLRASLAEK